MTEEKAVARRSKKKADEVEEVQTYTTKKGLVIPLRKPDAVFIQSVVNSVKMPDVPTNMDIKILNRLMELKNSEMFNKLSEEAKVIFTRYIQMAKIAYAESMQERMVQYAQSGQGGASQVAGGPGGAAYIAGGGARSRRHDDHRVRRPGLSGIGVSRGD